MPRRAANERPSLALGGASEGLARTLVEGRCSQLEAITTLCQSLGYRLFGRCWGGCGGRRVLFHTRAQLLACEVGPSAIVLAPEPTPAKEVSASLG
jgi:hypothetical protein